MNTVGCGECRFEDEAWRHCRYYKYCVRIARLEAQAKESVYVPIPKQSLLDCHLNIFGLDLFLESFLKANGVPDEFSFFYPIRRKDCAEFKGVNVRLEPVMKP